MLSKREVLTLLVAWSRMNDSQLADEDACLPSDVCSPADRGPVRRAARLVDHLRKRFSYTESPSFCASLDGKSVAYGAMRKKLEDEPVKRVAHLASFDSALCSILSTQEAYDLVPSERHAELDALAGTLRQLGNPE